MYKMSVKTLSNGGLVLNSLAISNTRNYLAGQAPHPLSLTFIPATDNEGFAFIDMAMVGDGYLQLAIPQGIYLNEEGLEMDASVSNVLTTYFSSSSVIKSASQGELTNNSGNFSTGLGAIYTFKNSEGADLPANFYQYPVPSITNPLGYIYLVNGNGDALNDVSLPSGTYMCSVIVDYTNSTLTGLEDAPIKILFSVLNGDTNPPTAGDFDDAQGLLTTSVSSGGALGLPPVSSTFPVYISSNTSAIYLNFVSNAFINTSALTCNIVVKFMRVV